MEITKKRATFLLCVVWTIITLTTLWLTHLQMLEVANPDCGSLKPEYCEEYLRMMGMFDLTYERAFTYTITIIGLIFGLPATIWILLSTLSHEDSHT